MVTLTLGIHIASKDQVYSYACNLMSIGMFFLVYQDAIKEGDGECILECWLPLFHSSGITNYTNKAFIFLCQDLFDLPPQQAEQN